MTVENFKKLIEVKDDGRLRHRESKRLEFKANFNFNSMNQYSKTFASFANSTGGIIIFGIKDTPREPIGMTNENFENIDTEQIANFLNTHFAPEIKWEMYSFFINDKNFGVFIIEESKNKPVMCTKETKKQITNEGEIYYRYSGRSEKIKYADLKSIFDTNKEIEQKKWMEHIESIAKIGPQNIALIDILRGNIENTKDKQIVIDKELLKEITLIQEGKFVEKDGAPALKLIGSVEGVETFTPNFNLDDDFYSTKELGEKLNLLSPKGSTAYMTAVIWKYDLQNNSSYYQHKHNQKLYSKVCYEFLLSKKINLDKAKEIHKEYIQRDRL